MDPKHSGDVLKHLEKQDELLMDAHRSMSHELQKLKVEQEMLMLKYYEFMVAQKIIPQKTAVEDEETSEAGALVVASREEQV